MRRIASAKRQVSHVQPVRPEWTAAPDRGAAGSAFGGLV